MPASKVRCALPEGRYEFTVSHDDDRGTAKSFSRRDLFRRLGAG